jgi:hypothetical protein
MPTFNPSGATTGNERGRVGCGRSARKSVTAPRGDGPKIGRGFLSGRTAGQLDINQAHNQPIVAHSAATDVKTMIKKKSGPTEPPRGAGGGAISKRN